MHSINAVISRTLALGLWIGLVLLCGLCPLQAANPTTAQWQGTRNAGVAICYANLGQGVVISGTGVLCNSAAIPSIVGFSGIDCTGVTDSTTGFQVALGLSQGLLRIPGGCSLQICNATLPQAVGLLGDGDRSVLRLGPSCAGAMLNENTAASTVVFRGLLFDGNYQNNGGDNSSAKPSFILRAGGTSTTLSANLTIEDVTFINGGASDFSFIYANSAFPTKTIINNVRHYGGMMNGTAGGFGGAVDATISNVILDLQRVPSSGAANTGRAGYIFQASGGSDTSTRSATITNLQCYDMGKTTSNNLGCVDSYSAGDHFIISNSFSKDAFGRGFTTKGSVKNLVFSNMMVSNLRGNADVAPLVSDCFAVYPGVADVPAAGYDVTMSGLQCLNSGYGGIEIEGVDNAGTDALKNVNLTNFIIDGCDGLGSGGHGLRIRDAINVTARNGIITNCDTDPIVVLLDAAIVTPGWLSITDNLITSTAAIPDFDPRITASGKFWYARNIQGKAFSTTDLTLPVTTGSITAWSPLGYIATGSTDQTVSTILGVPNGESFTLGQTSAAHVLNVVAGGNVQLNGTKYATKDVRTTLTVASLAGTLTEIGRANAAGLEYAGVAPTVGTGAGDCGTSPVVASYSNNSAGRITVGSGANGSKCTLMLGAAWTNNPMCSASNETTTSAPVAAQGAGVSSIVLFGTFLAGDVLSYQCSGAQ